MPTAWPLFGFPVARHTTEGGRCTDGSAIAASGTERCASVPCCDFSFFFFRFVPFQSKSSFSLVRCLLCSCVGVALLKPAFSPNPTDTYVIHIVIFL